MSGCPGPIKYARTSDGIDIAYTVFGQEGPDLLIAPGFVTHLDLMWELPPFQPLTEYGRNFRVIVLDKRGTGLSDRSLGFGSVEDRTEDIRAVLDAAGSEQAIIYGMSESGPMAMYFTATHPERVRALVLYGTFAKGTLALAPRDAAEAINQFIATLEQDWGTGRAFGLFLSHAPDAATAERLLARYERSACTPQMCREIMLRNLEIDVTSIVPAISVPTLVVHAEGDPVVPAEHGRFLSETIPNAEYAEVDADFHASWRPEHLANITEPIDAFLRDIAGQAYATEASSLERELATVLFTDIVSSTQRASDVGDVAWRKVLDRHEGSATEIIAKADGRLVKTTGDGLLATFTGPSRAVAAARGLQEAALSLGLSLRAGLHTGEIERRGDDIGGIGVHIAARVSETAGAGEILASRTVRDLAVGSQLQFEDRGTHNLKGIPEPWQLFAVR